jgi:hypothetical protein
MRLEVFISLHAIAACCVTGLLTKLEFTILLVRATKYIGVDHFACEGY